MLTWMLGFFGLAILAGMLAFGGVAAAGVAAVSKVFFIFAVALFGSSTLAIAWRGRSLSMLQA